MLSVRERRLEGQAKHVSSIGKFKRALLRVCYSSVTGTLIPTILVMC